MSEVESGSAAPLRLLDLFADAVDAAPELFPAGTGRPTAILTALSRLDGANPWITRVAQDHRLVTPGTLFVARRGAKVDAHAHVPAAVAAGAVAVVGEVPLGALPVTLTVPYLQVRDARRALPYLAAALERRPSEHLRVLGVTGTDGKTTTSYLLHWLLSQRHEAALLSTAGIKVGSRTLEPLEGHFTTPEATEVQALLGRFLRGGASHVVLESSSHGFSLNRLDAVAYATGILTNLTPEHLDHHGSLEAYREAKATLVRRAGRSVVNLDDEHHAYFLAASREALTYGSAAEADVRIGEVKPRPGGLEFELSFGSELATVRLPMVGGFNAWNAAAAVAAAHLEGVPLGEAAERLESFPGVPGRMQVVQAEPVTVIADFAHTAPALAKALAAVRRPGGRTIVVVGAAGERDPGKRLPIGREAALGADLAVFTEEDSRSEDTGQILRALASGAATTGAREGDRFALVPDRREAIRWALRHARPGDVVLLAGKGHERTLERAAETLAWDEAAEARQALGEHRGRP